MKTNRFYTTLFILSFVIFSSASGISNPANNITGDMLKKNINKKNTGNKSENSNLVSIPEAGVELSYLRFDVDKFMIVSALTELPSSNFEYLRFDVSDYIAANEPEMMEMPVSKDMQYLRFDVNSFLEGNSDEMSEMPQNELEYLKFDVNTFIPEGNQATFELPVIE